MPRCWEKWSLLVVEVVMVITKFSIKIDPSVVHRMFPYDPLSVALSI
jgi:hypothetical protein